MAAMSIGGIPQFVHAATESLLLEVEINGFPSGKVGEFQMRDGVLMAKPSELRDLGVRTPESAADEPVALTALPGLSVRIDTANQVLKLTATSSSLIPAQLNVADQPPPDAYAPSATGFTLDYDLSALGDGNENALGALVNLRVFAPWGVISTGVLSNVGAQPESGRANTIVRLESTYSYSDTMTQRRYRVGDFITGSLAWTRPVRLGGIQVVSDFSMRPDLVTFPLPSVSGTAAVPSTVDVLVNGTRAFSGPVGAGPFEIPSLPVVTGAGTIALTLTDALGRQIVTTLPFYASSALLAPGLQTYSAQAGFVRRNFGVQSNDYGQLAASATWRRGLTPNLTVETSVEVTRGTVLAGGGVVMNLGNLVQANGAIALSTGPRGTGRQITVGAQHSGRRFNLGVSATLASGNYRDIAAMNGDVVPRLQLNANAGVSLGRFGSLGIAYSGVERDESADAISIAGPVVNGANGSSRLFDGIVFLQPAQRAHIVTASYSVQIGIVALYATGFRDFGDGRASGLAIGLTIPLGARGSIGVSGSADSGGRSAQIQLNRSITQVGEWGYQAFASKGETDHEFGQVQHKAGWGLITAGIDRIGTTATGRLGAQGSLSYLDGRVYPSNTIADSFAVVDTNGLAGVRVLQENRAVGRTDASGHILVPELRAFEINRLAIDPDDIPLDSSIAVTDLTVRPVDRSGVHVRFKVKVSHGALLKLVDAAGAPIPLGSTATLRSSGAVIPVGYDGEAYAEDLVPFNEAMVERPDGRRCAVAFAYSAVAGEIPVIGPLVCKE